MEKHYKRRLAMTVFEQLQSGMPYDIRDEAYQKEVRSEIDRSNHVCRKLRITSPKKIFPTIAQLCRI